MIRIKIITAVDVGVIIIVGVGDIIRVIDLGVIIVVVVVYISGMCRGYKSIWKSNSQWIREIGNEILDFQNDNGTDIMNKISYR